ncbi:MAG: hypothetical protein J6M14_01595 [Campylobacter sp.]|nr:hypothetical protein [Campylobacter sp.]
MSREIRFRIWDKEHKKLLINTDYKDFVINMQGQVYCISGYFDYAKVDEYDGVQISQFTGLKDRQGREIYEGDILKYGSCVEVVFYEPTMGRFMTELKKCNDESEIGEISSLSPYYTDNYKVIGNVYENSELLK